MDELPILPSVPPPDDDERQKTSVWADAASCDPACDLAELLSVLDGCHVADCDPGCDL